MLMSNFLHGFGGEEDCLSVDNCTEKRLTYFNAETFIRNFVSHIVKLL